MSPFVLLETFLGLESSAAGLTDPRPLVRVRSQVFFQVPQVREGLWAQRAFERGFTGVGFSNMAFELDFSPKFLAAEIALISLPISRPVVVKQNTQTI